jgi:hypothetical protein
MAPMGTGDRQRARTRRVVALSAGLLMAVTAGIPVARGASGPCTSNSASCMIEAAGKYLDALVSHEASAVPLAQDAVRTEQGGNTGNGADEIREGLESPVMDSISGIRDRRWFVEPETHNATVYYLLDSTTIPPTPAHTATGHIAERFKVINGQIHEIEAIFWLSPGPTEEGSGWKHNAPLAPPAQGHDGPRPCQDQSRACAIKSARTYLDALLSNNSSKIALAPTARRTINGGSPSNEQEIRDSLEPPSGDESNAGIRDLRWFVERLPDGSQNAIAFYLLDTSTIPPQEGVHTTTTHLVERFRVLDGYIHEIEAVFWASPGPSQEPSGWESTS